MNKPPYVHGLIAEFRDEEAVLAAARSAYEAGYRKMDAYTPFAVEGLAEALGYRPGYTLNYVVLLVLALGAAMAFAIQYIASVVDYPLNVGGRPLNSWPAFLPVTFETMILLAAIATFAGMLILNRLPARHRPVRNAPYFDLASRDRFFLYLEADDEQFDMMETRRFLESLNPVEVNPVEE